MLSVAVRICSCRVYKSHIPFASNLFKLYVKNYKILYGDHTIGSNVHSLVHVTEDMQRCGVSSLMQISTYKYENALRMLTLTIKHSNRPLEQVVRRTLERENINMESQTNLFDPKLFIPKMSYEAKIKHKNLFKKIECFPNIYLSGRKNGNDSWLLTKSCEIVKMLFVEQMGMEFFIHALKLKSKDAFFQTPISSIKLDIYASSGELEKDLHLLNIKSIKAKMMAIEISEQIVFIPLLHTLENFNEI